MNFSDLISFRKHPSNVPAAAPEEVVRFAKSLGLGVAKDPSGNLIAVPLDLGNSKADSSARSDGSWDKVHNETFQKYNTRETRIRTYDMMDGSGAEGAVVLDTYADETINVVENSQQAVMIEISDEQHREAIMQVLAQNNVLANMRQDVRSMCKYGDGTYTIEARRGTELVRIDEAAAGANATKIDNPLKAEDITLRWVQSPVYELLGYKEKVYRMKVTKPVDGGFKFEGNEFMPWEFSLFSIRDRDTFPYGNSILEKMRVPWMELQTLEKLLAATRANSVDRVAITVPGMGTDISSINAKLSQLKNAVKTLVQLGSTTRMTRNQDVGITEYFWIPEGFKVQKLSTAIAIGSPDDVVYFRDKLYNASRLPKGFFVLQENNGAQRPMSLRQQDIKFARSLIPVGEGYCEGLRQLITLIAFYLGADVSRLKVSVKLKKSPYISSEMLSMYTDIFGVVDKFIATKQVMNPEYKPTSNDIKRILDMIDAPTALFFPEEGEGDKWDGNTHQPKSLLEACTRNFHEAQSAPEAAAPAGPTHSSGPTTI